MIINKIILSKFKQVFNKFKLLFGIKRKKTNKVINKFLSDKFYLEGLSKETRSSLERVNHNGIVWAASKIADEVGFDEAIKFVESCAKGKQLHGAKLFRANASIDCEQSWLKHLNDYLSVFDIVPIKLTDAIGTRFSRLSAEAPMEAVDGPLISVIMPAYNAEATLMKSAQSILMQTWSNLELIIIDDCSSDRTWEIVQELARLDPRVTVFRNDVNVGPYVSKNLALRLAKGQYVTGQDADDWSHPQRIARDVDVLISSQGAMLANLSCMLRMTKEGKFGGFAKISASSNDGVSRVASISLMVETEFLRKVLGGWDSVRFGADSELINRIELIIGERFHRSDNIGMLCLDLETSLTNDPEHGVSISTGISPVRKLYRESYSAWHKRLVKNEAFLSFPMKERRFEAPEIMCVPYEHVEQNLQKLQEAQLRIN